MTTSASENAVVAIYDTHTAAEEAVKALRAAGLDMKRLSIIGRDYHSEEHVVGFYTAGDRMKFWGSRAAFWGSLWGMLAGGAFFIIPGIGPLVVMGPLVGWLAGALEGAALGGAVGVLGAALASIGIPKDSVLEYETAVKAGRFVVLAHATPDMITHARVVLGTSGASLLVSHRLATLATRDDILKLLSDAELAQVNSSGTAPRPAVGEEFLDLETLELGIRKTLANAAPAGTLLPRKAVHEETWGRILARLDVRRTESPHSLEV